MKLLILIVCIPFFAISQSRIEGTVRDNQNLIPFCSIYFSENPSIGVSSNEKGEYILIVADSLIKSNIRFSAVGFNSIEISVNNLIQNPHVILTEYVKMLDEVRILSSKDEAGAIAQKAFERYDFNFPNTVHTLKGFYREISFNKDSVYLWLQEADLIVQDQSYRKEASKIRIQINELRRSDDNRSKLAIISFMRKFVPKQIDQNNLYKTYQTPIRNYHHKILRLGESFLTSNEFYIEAYSKDINDSLVILRYESLHNHRTRNYSGRITINLEDNAIIQIEDLVNLYSDSYYSLVQFRKIDEHYYPVFIKEISPGKDDYDNEIQVRTISFYEIITNKKEVDKIRKKNIASREKTLDEVYYSYNESFWNTYEVFKNAKLPPKVLTTLETRKPLTQQFRQNGSLKD